MLAVASIGEQRARRERQDIRKFRALIATPGNLATGVTLPANAQVYVSTTSALAARTVLITVNDVDKYSPIQAAGRRDLLGFVQRGRVVKKKVGAPGTVSVYVQDGLGKLHKIAQG